MESIIAKNTSLWLCCLLLAGCIQQHKPDIQEKEPGENIEAWMKSFTNADTLAEEAKLLIKRTVAESPGKVKPLVKTVCEVLYNRGALQQAKAIAAYPYGVNPEESPVIAGRMLVSTLLPGRKAPPVKGLSRNNTGQEGAVILFYETACRSCQQVIAKLKEDYGQMNNKRIRVITVSTDTNQKMYMDYALTFPWQDTLCDYQSFQGETPTRYGVFATPALFLVDKKGIIVDSYESVEEITAAIDAIIH